MRILILVIAVLGLLAAACGGNGITNDGSLTGERSGNRDTSDGRFSRARSADRITSDGPLVGALGGPVRAVTAGEVDGTLYAFFGSGPLLVAADVSNPRNPVEAGRLLLPGAVNDLSFSESDEMVFVAGGFSGLRVVDVSSPAHMEQAGALETTGYAQDLHVTGSFAYVAAQTGGLRIVDVSNPAAPFEIGAYVGFGIRAEGATQDVPYGINDVAVSGGLAYVSGRVVEAKERPGAQTYGLAVIDVSSPESPIKMGDIRGEFEDVFLSGNLAFAANSTGVRGPRLDIIDVSDPWAPLALNRQATARGLRGIFVWEDVAYIAVGGSVLSIDVSDPANLDTGRFLGRSGLALDVFVADDKLFHAGDGLRIFDVSDSAKPETLGILAMPKSPSGVFVSSGGFLSKDWAYVTERDSGLRVVDASNPAEPTEVGFIEIPGKVEAVFVSNDVAYVTGRDLGLIIVDVKDPANPEGVGATRGRSAALNVFVADDLAFAGQSIVDISDSASPVDMGSFRRRSNIRDVVVAGNLAYLADGRMLRIVNISDPSAPVEVGSFALPGTSTGFDLFVDGGRAYLTSGALHIFDISDPSNPKQLSALGSAGGLDFDVDVSRDLAIVAQRGGDADYRLGSTGAGARGGLIFVDVSDPAEPKIVGAFRMPRLLTGVSASDGLAYVTDAELGLLVVDIDAVVAEAEGAGIVTPEPEFSATSIAEGVTLVASWGSRGVGNGEFGGNRGIAVDGSGNVYVIEQNNNRVQKFDANGKFLKMWGSRGGRDGQFDKPIGIAADGSGNVYVIDGVFRSSTSSFSKGVDPTPVITGKENRRVQIFNSGGEFLKKWGSTGSGDGQFNSRPSLRGAAVDGSGSIYVIDGVVKVFTTEGKFLRQWGTRGSGEGEFGDAFAIAVDGSERVYVTDYRGRRVLVFDAHGELLQTWGSSGDGDGEFGKPTGIAVDNSGKVYVVDTGNSRVQVFDRDGRFLAKWGSQGNGAGQFNHPEGIAVDASDNVYVTGNGRVQVFKVEIPTR